MQTSQATSARSGSASEARAGLRFCMVTTFYPPYNFGGDGIGVQRLVRGLARRGHHVTVMHDADAHRMLSGGEDPPDDPAEEGIEVVRLESRMHGLSPLLTQQSGRPVAHARTIRRTLEQGDFDVINFHNISLVGGPGLLSAGSALKLYMAHEHWLVCPTHVLYRHGREPCPGRQCLRCTLHDRRPPQLWRYTGYLERQLRHVDAFIAMSEFSRDKHHEFGFPRPMEVVPYMLPDDAGQPASRGEESAHERPYFLFVGRLERIKGLDDVIPVFRDGGVEADLLIAGEGDHGDSLRALAQGSSRVKFLGRVGQDELARYYGGARAVVMPSVCFETFGITLIEAFTHSVPVVARRIGPMPEIVGQAGGGELFETAEQLRGILEGMLADPERGRRMGAAARKAFTERWCESAVIPRYLDVVGRTAKATGRAALAEAVEREVAA